MIEVGNLNKYFGSKHVVDNVSFDVKKGEILGFLGPNGAGKSTTMRMITGFIPPTSGTAVIGGCDIRNDSIAARKKIGYLPENAPVYPDMTVSEYLGFCAEARGFQRSKRKSVVDGAIEKCFLSEVRHQTISTLSKGYKQRVCFAQSIIHDPEYLILDEPTDGLDPNQKHEVRQMIRKMSADKAIILSTHILEEMDAVCTRAVIIAKGRIVADDEPRGLRKRSATYGAVTLTVNRCGEEDAGMEDFLGRIEGLEAVKTVRVLDRADSLLTLRVYPVDAEKPLAETIVPFLSENRCEVKSIFVEPGRLDDVFRSITTG